MDRVVDDEGIAVGGQRRFQLGRGGRGGQPPHPIRVVPRGQRRLKNIPQQKVKTDVGQRVPEPHGQHGVVVVIRRDRQRRCQTGTGPAHHRDRLGEEIECGGRHGHPLTMERLWKNHQPRRVHDSQRHCNGKGSVGILSPMTFVMRQSFS
ncbi:hypothetical protein M2352_002597 [Azospirillum fermentarium]|nr:hypothetical protein [Azospirillum fermentarium]